MNEKYNSEKNLRSTYESYQMPFENEAFEKFKLELDREEQKKKVFWWRRLSLFLIPIFLVGFVSTYALFQYQKSAELSPESHLASQESKTTEDMTLSVSDATSQPNIDSSVTVHSNPTDSNLNTAKSERKESNFISATQTPASEHIANKMSSNNSSNEDLQLSLPTTITTNPIVYDWSLNLTDANSSSSFSTISKTSATSGIVTFPSDDSSLAEIGTSRSTISKTILPLLNLSNPVSLNIDPIYFLNEEVKPYVKPFQKYFYVNLRGGFVINDNFGSSDPYLSILKPKEYTYGGVLAYQFSTNYALELSVAQHDFSVGYRIEDSSYLRKNGMKATVIKAALVSKLWSPFKGVNFNLTNGVAIMSGDNGSFGKGSSGRDTPDFIQNAVLERFNLSSSNHYLYACGLQANFRLSPNTEFSLSSEYNFGTQPWIDSRLKYFEGEGVIRTVATGSNGSFFGFNLGLKYNLQ